MTTIQYNSKGQLHGTCQFEAWTALYDNGIPLSVTLNDGTVIKPDKNTKITNYKIVFRNDAGVFHREDGPAYINTDGYKEWWINNELHREDGPAYIYPNGYKAWYINDKYYGDTEEPPEEYLQALVDRDIIQHVDAFVRGSDNYE